MTKFPKCEIEACTIPAKYGMPGETHRRCDSHQLRGMMLYPDTRCSVQVERDGQRVPCGEQAIFGDRHTPKRCDDHKSAYIVNHIANKTCSTCGTFNILTLRGTCLNTQRCSQRVLHEIMKEKHKEIEARNKEEKDKRKEEDKQQAATPKRRYTRRTNGPVFPFSVVGPIGGHQGAQTRPIETSKMIVKPPDAPPPPPPVPDVEETKPRKSAKPRKYTKRSECWNKKKSAIPPTLDG